MSKSRIAIVDDHALIRAGLRALFNQQPDLEVIGEGASAKEAIEIAIREKPDLMTLDLTLPGGGSLEAVKKIREEVGTRVLMFSMHDDPAYARAAIANGATGYVVKTIGEQDLLASIRSVKRGHLIVDLDDEAKTASVFSGSPSSAQAKTKSAAQKLSDRELEVLALLGQGHTNQSVAELLDISPKTVATYRSRIGEKLGLHTTAEFVKYVSDTGLATKPATD